MTFITLEVFFEPVMFFSLMNLSVTFQMMINKILWDLVNTREVVSFIDNMIIGTKKKVVVKRLVENDLYVKLEKCK